MKRTAKFVSVAFALFLSWSAHASSEYRWIGQITEDGAALSYAIPNSDAIKIDFHCDRKTRLIVVNYEHEPKAAKDGLRLAMRLALRGQEAAASVSIPAKGQRLELDDKFLLSGEIRMSAPLRSILSSEGIMLVTIGGHAEEIPLKGAPQAARRLFATCPG